MFTGIDHIDLIVEDPEKMAKFLMALGFKEIRHTVEARGSIELRFPGGDDQPFVELRASRKPDGTTRPLGLNHIALRCDNLDETFKTLSEKGMKFSSQPRVVETSGRRLANLIDPEGHSLQIVG